MNLKKTFSIPKVSALALVGAVGFSGLALANPTVEAQAEDANCGEIRAALAIDNSPSITDHPDEKAKVIKAYTDFIENAKSLDPNAEITLFPIMAEQKKSGNNDGDLRYYSKVFKLGDQKDFNQVKSLIED